jgi:pimeloyl-ACP methyl ester carboxylesterase
MHNATSTGVAEALARDWQCCDCTSIAERLDPLLPVLHVVHVSQATAARAWLDAHAPDSRLATTCSHLGFWEEADEFNCRLLAFLRS